MNLLSLSLSHLLSVERGMVARGGCGGLARERGRRATARGLALWLPCGLTIRRPPVTPWARRLWRRARPLPCEVYRIWSPTAIVSCPSAGRRRRVRGRGMFGLAARGVWRRRGPDI